MKSACKQARSTGHAASEALVVMGALCGVVPATATPLLGTAQSFSVIGHDSVTNTGNTTLWGDLGVQPGTSYTGSGTVTQTGTTHIADAVALQARIDATNAYNILAGQPVTHDLTGFVLGVGAAGTLTPGVYRFDTSAQLTGALTLNATGFSDALFIFEIGSTLTTASGSSVAVTGGDANTGVFWQVGSSATLGTTTAFEGNIIALASVTLNNSATILCGRAFALTGAVTLNTNTISNDCSNDNIATGNDYGSGGFSPSPTAGSLPGIVPEPSTLALVGLAFLGLRFARRRPS